MNILNNISHNKIIIPVLLAGSIVAINNSNQKSKINNEQNIEYMANNPTTLTMEAGLLGLLGKRRKDTNIVEEETQINNTIKDWNEIRISLMSLADDLYNDKEETDVKIDKLIEKIDKNALDEKFGEYAKRGLEYIKKHSEDIVTVDFGCTGRFEDDAENLYWSVFHTTKAALYPDLVDKDLKENLPKWMELGNAYMNENS